MNKNNTEVDKAEKSDVFVACKFHFPISINCVSVSNETSPLILVLDLKYFAVYVSRIAHLLF